jgi:hypothetical protein
MASDNAKLLDLLFKDIDVDKALKELERYMKFIARRKNKFRRLCNG